MIAEPATRAIRVVIADDSAGLRVLMRSMLEREGGFEIAGEAADGAEAVAAARHQQPDVILLDLAMPVMDGLEAIPLIRVASPDTRIVVLSGFEASHMEEEARRAGADSYISKGASPDQIIAGVRSFWPEHNQGPRGAGAWARGESETLLQAEDRFRTMVQEVTDHGIFMLDRDGLVASWNRGAASITGYTAGEIIGRHFSCFFTPEAVLRGDPDRALAQAAATGRCEEEGWRVRKDGSRLWVSAVISALRDSRGDLRGFAKVTRDVTRRHEAEESIRRAHAELAEQTANLERSNADLEQFAHVASHDLQEPLRMVASYVQLLDRHYRGRLDQDADEYIAAAVDGATRMQALITGLLAFSRAGTGPMELTAVDVGRCVSAALANLTTAIQESGADVVCGDLPQVRGEALHVTQLFQNLIGNALKFRGDAPPRVEITAVRAGQSWTFSVRDNGIGIDSHHADRIFQVFQRLHTRDQYPGTGIGLALCKKVVERLGGRIWVESEPGRGSTFRFTLPAA